MRAKIGINYHPLEKRFLVAIPMKIFEYMKYGLAVVTVIYLQCENLLAMGKWSNVIDNTVDGLLMPLRRLC